MEIITQDLTNSVLITVKGRVDSASSPQLEQALAAVHERGIYRIVMDLSELQYMSSAGFRAVIAAQRTSKSHHRGEVVLAGVPDRIRPALEVAGFGQLFEMFDSPRAALEYVGSPLAGDSTTDAPPPDARKKKRKGK